MAEGGREKSKKYPGVYWRTNTQTGERTYYIRYRLGGRGSKEVEEPVKKSSEGMTEARAAQVRALKIAGKVDPNTVKRVKDQAAKDAEANRWTVAKLWGAYKDAKTLSTKRVQTDQSRFDKYLNEPFGSKTPEEIDALAVARLTKKLKDAKLAPATIWGILELLSRVINYGANLGLSQQLGFKVEKPRLDNERTEFMSEDQLRAYLKALDEELNQDDASFFRVMLLTGIRRSALLNLRWDDIDFEKGFVTLRGEVAKGGKTKTLPLSPAAVAILQRITRRGEYVWTGKSGDGPREDFRRMGRRLRDKAGLPKDFRPCHGLRHHFATALASSGEVDLYVLQRLLTHGSPTMTARYGHLTDAALKRATGVADGILEAGKDSKVVKLNGNK
jgi:integrase